MQGSNAFSRRAGLLALLAILFLATTMIQITPTQAQTQPTATPSDPLWNAFSRARDAVEDKFHVDLTIVRNWQFTETEFTDGIDSCVALEDPSQARQLYFGWRFVITALDGRQFEGRSSFNYQIITACDTVTEPVTSGAGATGDLPAPVAGSAAIGGFELGGQVLELNANTVNLAKRSGMTWVKTQLSYSLGQDPGTAAGFINAAHANGFKALLSIKGDKSQLGGDYQSYINSFSQFVGGVAALGVDAIEVWNEANIDREWPAGSINGGTYTQLLAGAFNAIKSRNGNTIVISGAPAPTGFFGSAGCTANGCNDDVFMQQMAQAGAGSYMDCVGLHYNEAIIAPTQSSGDPRGGYPTYYFSSMLQRGYGPFGGKPVCFTELGYLTGQGYSQAIPANFAWANNTTVAQQAAWLASAATLSAQSGKVRLMIVWNVDFPFFTDTDPMGGYAIFRPDGSCPSCDSLSAVMH